MKNEQKRTVFLKFYLDVFTHWRIQVMEASVFNSKQYS